MMKKTSYRYLIILLMGLFRQTAYGMEFYISPKGNDLYPGTRQLPFATIAHARDAVRKWNRLHGNEQITIWMFGGEYQLSETVVFGLQDQAKHGQTISYSAIPGQKPVINSDIPVTGWKKVNYTLTGLPVNALGKVWVVSVPETVKDFKTLFNASGMLPRAKTRVIAHLRKSDDWMGTPEMHHTIPFIKETVTYLFNPSHAEIVVIPAAPWTMNILPVQRVDSLSGMVYLGANSTYALAAPRYYMGPDAIWVENTFAGLDTAGNWVFDKAKRLLYYWPVDDQKPGNDIVIPNLIEMICVEGKIDEKGAIDIPVLGLAFKGLTFSHGDRFESAGLTGMCLQHDWEKYDATTALVRFRGAENCIVEDCFFINSGGAGIRMDLYAQNNHIDNNVFSELGGTAILLAGYGPGTKDVNKKNTVSNNSIHYIGRLWWHATGIWAWQSGQNIISHNTICHVPYDAITVTGRINWDKSGKQECSQTIRWNETGSFNGKEIWEDREQFLHSRENVIEANDIHDVMEIMQDGNGIYISGAGRGNRVTGNFLHDTPIMAAGEAIRCDDDQHDCTISNNIIFRYGTHGIGICSKGRNNIFNNIIASPPYRVINGLIAIEPEKINGCSGSKVMHNILYGTTKNQPFQLRQGLGCVDADFNIYFNTSDTSTANEYLQWAHLQGIEENSKEADPLFADPANGDFRLHSNSPALALGFKTFEFTPGRIIK